LAFDLMSEGELKKKKFNLGKKNFILCVSFSFPLNPKRHSGWFLFWDLFKFTS